MIEPVTLDVAARLKRKGCVMRLVTPGGSAAAPAIDRTLVKAVVQGRAWWQELQANTGVTLEDIARREGITAPYVVRIVRSPSCPRRCSTASSKAHCRRT